MIIPSKDYRAALEKVEKALQEYMEVAIDVEPNINLWNFFAVSPDVYKRKFVEQNYKLLSLKEKACIKAFSELRQLKKIRVLRRKDPFPTQY